MIRALALLIALAPGLAEALSCTPWGVTDAYLSADASPRDHIIVRGALQFDERLWPQVDLNRQDETPPLTLIPGRIEGHAFSRNGPDVPFAIDVTVQVACFGPWCAGPAQGDVLAFVERTDDGHAVSFDPCGGTVFARPTADQIKAVTRCLKGRRCPATGFQ
ncbi:hypothetical protein [Tateyamaria sp. SN6-1]|uniref:hypothetical protein n=1 Tax=Tateyamaria sp. SN6-1 TaxID=3092148 RepID=UPI0039F49BD6